MDFQQQPHPVYAIIPAAGTGSRMQGEKNKQFLQIGRYPVIIRTLRVFAAHPRIDGFVVTAAQQEVADMQELIRLHGIGKCLGVVAGGATRQASVANGLLALAASAVNVKASMVLVHDGARCFLTPEIIGRVIDGIALRGACGAAVQVKDTIKLAGPDGRVLSTPERDRLWAMQTPQGSWFETIYDAYQRATAENWQTTDDLSVLEQAGLSVWLTPGDYRNIKLTTPEDRLLAEQLAILADQYLL